MNSEFCSLLICLAVILLGLTGCGAGTNQTPAADKSIITLNMSDEAKAYEKAEIAQDGVKTMLSEACFDYVVEALSARSKQTFPECTVKNRLESMEYLGSQVYTLTKEGYENVVLFTHGGGLGLWHLRGPCQFL